MVVLYQNHVKKPDSVIRATAKPHSLLFKHTHSWSGLACIKDFRFESFKLILIAACHSRDSAHALHDVEQRAFGHKQ